jgi:hypothetical protein
VICRKCKEVKLKEDFYKGHRVCKKCIIKKAVKWKRDNPEKTREWTKKNRILNKEKIQTREKSYREKNRDKTNAAAKKYRETHRDLCRERCRKHYHENRDKYRHYREDNKENFRIYSQEYRKRHLEKIRDRHRELAKKYRKEKPLEHKARKSVYQAIKNGKLERSKNCTICGIKTKTDAHHYDYEKPENVTWVCKKCHGIIHAGLRKKTPKEVKNGSTKRKTKKSRFHSGSD